MELVNMDNMCIYVRDALLNWNQFRFAISVYRKAIEIIALRKTGGCLYWENIFHLSIPGTRNQEALSTQEQ